MLKNMGKARPNNNFHIDTIYIFLNFALIEFR